MSLPVDAAVRGVALVPDCLVNPDAPRYAYLELAPPDLLATLGRCGFGLLQLPSHVAGDPEEGQGVTGVARDAADYARAGFVVVVLALAQVPDGAVWRAALQRELARWGAEPLPELVLDATGFPASVVETFLTGQLTRRQRVAVPPD
ncbi:MAG TPA: hypothetical protein VFW79_00070 [Cellulomonas sp.]|uniref:hypothetical protein n=1 Tax=Cellulomonas sp. TaxID=40001 RepID=UPI002E2F9320|nr:hypothetical protein [Cellulomonas sp.]HEX5331016.1 hypothetical protein [Cellulomonas sp.]